MDRTPKGRGQENLSRTTFSPSLGYRGLLKKAIRYGLLGGLGSLLYIGVIITLVEIFELQPTISSIVGFLCVIAIIYLPNHFWVFESTRAHHSSFPRFVLVSGIGLLTSTLAMFGAVNLLGLSYMWGVVGATAVVPPANFLLNALWTFK